MRLPWRARGTATTEEQHDLAANFGWLLEYPAQTAALVPQVQGTLACHWPTWDSDRDRFQECISEAVRSAEFEFRMVREFIVHSTRLRDLRSRLRGPDSIVPEDPALARALLPIGLNAFVRLAEFLCLLALGAWTFFTSDRPELRLAAGFFLGLAVVVPLGLAGWSAVKRGLLSESTIFVVYTTIAGAAIAGLVAVLTREDELGWQTAGLAGILLAAAVISLISMAAVVSN